MMELTEVPKPGTRDYVLGIFRGAISSIPFPLLPGIAGELFSFVVTTPLEKRRDEWVVAIAEGLVQLQEKVEGLTLEGLSEDEGFVTVVLQATHVALRNHQEEKLEALRNAVLNSALPGAPEDDMQIIFLGLVDTLTPWHLRILKLFDDPLEWSVKNQRRFPENWALGNARQILELAYPELRGQDDLRIKILKDLSTYGLADIPSGTATFRGMLEPRTSNFGKQFLQFITTPHQLG